MWGRQGLKWYYFVINVEAAKQGESGPCGQVCSLQPWRGDGGHWHEEWRVCHLVGEQPESLGEKKRPEICYPRHQVHCSDLGREKSGHPPSQWFPFQKGHGWNSAMKNLVVRGSLSMTRLWKETVSHILRHAFANFHESVVKTSCKMPFYKRLYTSFLPSWGFDPEKLSNPLDCRR